MKSREGASLGVERRRVIVCDDDAEMRALLADAFTDWGFAVVEARDADEIVALMKSRSDVDLVVTDVRMPGRDGFDVLNDLRAVSAGTPVVFITGFATEQLASAGLLAGARAVIAKPFDLAELRSISTQAAAQCLTLPRGSPESEAERPEDGEAAWSLMTSRLR